MSRRTLFSPQDDVEQAIVTAIATVQQTLRIALFAFTSRPLLQALVAAKHRGVAVQLVLDRSQSIGVAAQQVLGQLGAAGIPFVLTTSPVGGAIMHHKFAVLDDRLVIAGSYNWTHMARIEANTIDITDTDPSYAARFTAAWQLLWAFAQTHPHAIEVSTIVHGAGMELEEA